MKSLALSPAAARRIWLRAQRLDTRAPFGAGAEATRTAIEHLGYVQIDTINVVERCHHHILYSRIPDYRRADLQQVQSVDKSVFEYWTHALAYVPTRDIAFYLGAMKAYAARPEGWFGNVGATDLRRLSKRLETEGPLSIRDIDDDVLVEKDHLWASRKPSKRALELGFYTGRFTVTERRGIVKTYDLTDRHFGWERRPRPASDSRTVEFLLDRALRAQGLVSLDSVCHLNARRKPAIRALIERRIARKSLVPVHVDGAEKLQHWMTPQWLEQDDSDGPGIAHILSPFDPLIIQRKRTALIFGYDHVFEAYLPRERRRFGYFTLPVLVGDAVVAALDLKADRAEGVLRIQNWTWTGAGNEAAHRQIIEDELGRFERFQFGP